MQNLGYELPRIPLPRTSVNKILSRFIADSSPRYTVSDAAVGKTRKAEMTDSKPTEPRAEQEYQQRDAASEEKSELSNSKPKDRDDKEQEVWYERTRCQILLFVVGIALFGLVLGLILDWYIDPKNSTQKKDLVQALGLITAGVAGAVGIFFTWRGQRLAREAQEHNQRNTQKQLRLSRRSQEHNQKSTQAQLENAQEELRLTRLGQITESFTRAIDQLGNESLDIRLGGIYALERIAKESEEDYWAIMEILTAYVREHARRPSAALPASTAVLDNGAEQQTEEATGRTDAMTAERRAPPQSELLPPADIQTAITVLGRLSALREHDETVPPFDLHETNLSKGRLYKANLYRCNLWKANLSGANLAQANLYKANFKEADLFGANLSGANLEEANFREANLRGAYLEEAFLKGAQIYEADLEKAKLQEANLQEALLWGANLYKADLFKADLFKASYSVPTSLTLRSTEPSSY